LWLVYKSARVDAAGSKIVSIRLSLIKKSKA
jgi:hypothetical protein